jgi:hypothetical protein
MMTDRLKKLQLELQDTAADIDEGIQRLQADNDIGEHELLVLQGQAEALRFTARDIDNFEFIDGL